MRFERQARAVLFIIFSVWTTGAAAGLTIGLSGQRECAALRGAGLRRQVPAGRRGGRGRAVPRQSLAGDRPVGGCAGSKRIGPRRGIRLQVVPRRDSWVRQPRRTRCSRAGRTSGLCAPGQARPARAMSPPTTARASRSSSPVSALDGTLSFVPAEPALLPVRPDPSPSRVFPQGLPVFRLRGARPRDRNRRGARGEKGPCGRSDAMTRTIRALAGLGLAVAILAGCSLTYPTPRKFAILYGIATYPAGNSLAYPDDDALAMETMLLANGFAAGDVITRINAPATKANLVLDLASVAAVAGPNDLVLLLLLGPRHGVPVPGRRQGMDPPHGIHRRRRASSCPRVRSTTPSWARCWTCFPRRAGW